MIIGGKFRRLKIVAAVAGVVVVVVYLANTSLLADPIAGGPFLIAHRALGQGFDREGLTGQTCTAERMLPSEHGYLENTIPAMQAAFDYGADFVEFDVHPTTDDRIAVFHDWTVDCRTEGTGVTREHTLADLQALDVGYGYTADGGATWPFRGEGVGMLPSLEQVLTTFPDRNFFIDIKGGDPSEGKLLAEWLAVLTASREGRIALHGRPQAVDQVRKRLPQLRTITRPQLKRCLKRYLALGWIGYVPTECRHTVLMVPANVAPWLWGWPNRLLRRMDDADTRVVLIGDYDGTGFSQGFDDLARLTELPLDYSGGIWTDRIDLIGPAIAERRRRLAAAP